MSDKALSETERMLIEWQCARLVTQFALFNDAYDFEAMTDLMTEDAVLTRPTIPDKEMVGRAFILEQFKLRPPRTIRHVMANTLITVESPTAARGVCYMILYSGPAAAEGQNGVVADGPQMLGAFHDRFVKVGGGWKFAERRGSLAVTTAPAA